MAVSGFGIAVPNLGIKKYGSFLGFLSLLFLFL